jgi:lipopolysaccharide transport system ATP-binding protein
MIVRLAFAVAAHLEPEILVIDEVLAVGDAAFQKKCLGKMQDVAGHGRTVLFVSHQMAAVENLCSRCVVLDTGRSVFDGDTKEAITHYLQGLQASIGSRRLPDNLKRSGTGEIVLTGFGIENEDGNPLTAVSSGEPVILAFDYQIKSNRRLRDVSIGFSIHSKLGDTLSVLYSDYTGVTFSDLPERGTLRCRIEDFPFSIGRYHIGARLMAGRAEADWPRGPIGFIDVQAGDFYGTGNSSHSGIGPVLLRGEWQDPS